MYLYMYVLFFMDMQIGHSSVQREVDNVWQFLEQPGVDLALDPADDYRIFDNQQLIQYPGFKLFYKLDKPLISPSDELGISPAPLMVMYQ